MKNRTSEPEGFHERLKQAYLESGVGMLKLEKVTGIRHNRLYDYMKGAHAPGCLALAKLCAELRVSADWLLFGGEKK